MSDRQFKFWINTLISLIFFVIFYQQILAVAKLIILIPQSYFFQPVGDYQVKKAPNEFTIMNNPKPTITLNDLIELRSDFESRNFSVLNTKLSHWQSEFEMDVVNELKLYDALRIFEVQSVDYEMIFSDWIAFSPELWQPYISRASYYVHNGWESRGGAWAFKTSNEQFANMHLYFNKAEKDLKTCIEIKPELYLAYDRLISINTAGSGKSLKEAIIQQAVQKFPNSFIVMSSAAWANEPRWGGTYEQMEAIADSAAPYLMDNPELSVLYGFIYRDQADRLDRRKKYRKAEKLYKKALQYGLDCPTCNDFAMLYYYRFDDPQKALGIINQGMAFSPNRAQSYSIRARIYFKLKDYDNSLNDLGTAEKIAITNEDISEMREWASATLVYEGSQKQKEHFNDALADFNMALQFSSRNEEAYFWRGYSYYKNKNFTLAENDLRTAIQLKPDYFKAYKWMDYTLMQKRDWDTIISFWNQYLAIQPNDAEAYFERSGTYYHKGNMENAMDDLRTACSLGHKEACQRLNKMSR